MKILVLEKASREEVKEVLDRSMDLEEVRFVVSRILEDVRERGDDALIEYTWLFDKVKLDKRGLKVKKEEVEEAYQKVPREAIFALRRLAKNVEAFSKLSLPSPSLVEVEEGLIVGTIYRPIDSVGVYVPGGRASYPSTLLMATVPALVAGVNRLVVCTPPSFNGALNPYVLVAADMVGVKEVYKVGGAQAIGAMAYGTGTIPRVDKIVGPGNVYVTLAKVIVRGEVEIDFVAGPSEVLIMADEASNPEYVAADLISQAEHDPNSSCVLVTTSQKLAIKVQKRVESSISEAGKARIIEKALLKRGAIIVTKSLEKAVEFVNEYAPEHLEIVMKNPKVVLDKIKNAGTIFVGAYSPVSIGDYYSGASHILPTAQSSKVTSGLSVRSFLKEVTVQMATKRGLRRAQSVIKALSKMEGLPAHAKSVEVRLKRGS